MENHERYSGYKLEVLQRLYQRNQNERKCFEDIILLSNNQYESLNKLQLVNSKLTVSNDKLQNIIDSGSYKSGKKNLLKRIRKQNREYAQDLEEKEKEIAGKENENQKLQSSLTAKEDLLKRIQAELDSKEKQLQFISVEYASQQRAFASVMEQMQKVKKDTWLTQLKAEDADHMTPEKELLMREEVAEEELEEPAAIETYDIKNYSDQYLQNRINIACVDAILPKKEKAKADPYKFVAHDREVNAVAWTHSGLFTTAGGDSEVKMWGFVRGQVQLEGVANESNSSICSVDFDTEGKLILAASNDGASRIWTLKDMKLQKTLTGHSQKVMSAKFFDESDKVVSGSCDRTLKIWDWQRRACIQSIFAGSRVNDVVTNYLYGTNIISGHFDKKIRFWDIRTNSRTNTELSLEGRITSLDVSPDGCSLLSCTRDDDSLQLIDVRMNEVVLTLRSDGFQIGSDWTRPKFSRDGKFCVCGSRGGDIYIWHVSTGALKKVLGGHSSTVTVCDWSWCGQYLLSCDRNGNATLWFENNS